MSEAIWTVKSLVNADPSDYNASSGDRECLYKIAWTNVVDKRTKTTSANITQVYTL